MYLFAAQIEETHAEEHGAGHGANPFQDNLINWLLLLVFLGWLIAKNLPPVFNSRRQSIESEISAAATAKAEASAFLESQRQQLADVEKDIQKMIADAKHAAQQSTALIEEQTTKEMNDLLIKFESAIQNERRLLVTELRTAAVKAAVAISQEQLSNQVNERVKSELLNKFMSELDTIARSGDSFEPGKFESTAHSRNN